MKSERTYGTEIVKKKQKPPKCQKRATLNRTQSNIAFESKHITAAVAAASASVGREPIQAMRTISL